jgi:hypothetical protein
MSECDQVKINNLDTCCEYVEEGRTTKRNEVKAFRSLFGKPKGKRPLRRPRLRREYIFKVDFSEMEWEGEDHRLRVFESSV